MNGSVGRRVGRLVVIAVVLTAGGCTSRPEPGPSASAPAVALPSVSLSPLDTSVVAVQEAIVAYRGMWDSYLEVLAAPDPDSPELGRYATGKALTTLVAGVRDVRDKGLKGEGRFIVAPKVTEVAPASAPQKIVLRDCVNTAQSRIVRASPGPAYTDKPGGRQLCLATVQRQPDGTWKVTSFGLHGVGSCT